MMPRSPPDEMTTEESAAAAAAAAAAEASLVSLVCASRTCSPRYRLAGAPELTGDMRCSAAFTPTSRRWRAATHADAHARLSERLSSSLRASGGSVLRGGGGCEPDRCSRACDECASTDSLG